MADLTTLRITDELFLDDIRDLYIPGSVAEPTLVCVYNQVTEFGDGLGPVTQSELLLEGYFYGNADDARISLDFRNIFRRMFDNDLTGGFSERNTKRIKWEFGAESKEIRIYLCYSDIKSKITDIDYLAVPSDATLWLSGYAPGEYSFYLYVEQCGSLIRIEDGLSGSDYDRIVYGSLSVPDLPIIRNKPFRIVWKVLSSELSAEKYEYKSPVYEIIDDDFQQFIFADRFGGYTSFPMRGALEFSPEYEFENARYSFGNAAVSRTISPVFTQYTGGLTWKAAFALSGLLKSDFIYHKVNGSWKRIVVESADTRFQTVDSLHYGSFSFRYSEETTI